MPVNVLCTTCLNWLDPLDAHSAYHPWRTGLRIADIIPQQFELPQSCDLQFAVNGRVLTLFEAEVCALNPGDAVLVTVIPLGGGGGGKNPLATVAMLAVVVGAVALGPMIGGPLGAMWNSAVLTTSLPLVSVGTAASIGTGLLLAGGALAINAIMPAPKPNLGQGIGTNAIEESPNYGWSPSNPVENGRPVPILYGKKQNFAPFKACQYISTSGDKQYLNQLYLVGEGPVDSITDVQINGNPIGNYTDVTVDVRLGTPAQDVIPAFNDAVSETAVGSKLSTSWATTTLAGNNTQSLGIGISCLQGLWHANNSGGLDALSVTVDIEARIVGAPTWTHLDTQTITAAQRAAVRRYWRYAVPSGRYEVRVRFASQPSSDSLNMSDTWFEYVHEVVPDDFRLPNMACFAITALATDQLNGSGFTVTCTAERANLPLPDGAGGTAQRPASNPVWMALDLLLHRRYGVAWPVSQASLQDFSDAAAWCVSKGITGAMYFDAEMNFESAMAYLGRYGRFRIVPRGTKIGCISDKPEQFPAQGFLATSANILNGTFGVGYAALADRADAWEVTWFHPERGKETLFVPGERYGQITDRTPNVRQESLYPCTDEAQAYRWARFMDRCNRYLTRTVKLRCDAEALGPHVAPGRVIQIAHDVLHRTQAARVIAATTTQLTLNRPVTLEDGTTYQAVVRHKDRQSADTGHELHESVNVASVAQRTVTNVITLAAPLQFAPAEDAVVTVGELGRNVRWFRVLSISRTQDMRVQIEALEYDAAIYEDEGQPPSIPTTGNLPAVTGLTATIMQVVEDTLTKRVVSLTWRGDAARWGVYMRRIGSGGTAWVFVGSTSDPSFVPRNVEVGHVYQFAVTATGSPNDGQYVEVEFSDNALTGTLMIVTELDGTGTDVTMTETVNGTEQTIWEVA